MILRSVIEHVRTQNWTAVVIDFLIVVVGVFIGIQVANWNETRQNSVLASEYIARLHTDIELERMLWDRVIDYFGTARNYSKTAMDGFSTAPEDLDEQWLIALYQASQVWFAAPNRSTFDELQATGRIANIQNRDLRTTVANHYQRVAQTNFTLVQSSQYRRIARLHLHERVQNSVRESCGDQWVTNELNFYHVVLPQTCSIELPEEFLRSEIARLHTNEEVKQELRFHQSVLAAQIGVMTNATQTADATLLELSEAMP